VRHLLNEACCPTQDACIESFNGKFWDECPNEQWLQSLARARQEIAGWRGVTTTKYVPTVPWGVCLRRNSLLYIASTLAI
jgi:hypothetical protein